MVEEDNANRRSSAWTRSRRRGDAESAVAVHRLMSERRDQGKGHHDQGRATRCRKNRTCRNTRASRSTRSTPAAVRAVRQRRRDPKGGASGADREADLRGADPLHDRGAFPEAGAAARARGSRCCRCSSSTRSITTLADDGIIRRLFIRAFRRGEGTVSGLGATEMPMKVQASYFATRNAAQRGDRGPSTAPARARRTKPPSISSCATRSGFCPSTSRSLSSSPISALREGWDNPNVFQICTLREVGSETERRQQVGRGVRLPVDQTGERVHDETVNVLTVVASESYERFVSGLQSEIEAEYGGRACRRAAERAEQGERVN